MRFTYTYRSSDGQRHTAEIEAENRDAAFAKVRREMGIKPIRVVATDGGGMGESTISQPVHRSLGGGGFHNFTFPILAALLIAAIGAWLYFSSRSARPSQADDVIVLNTPQGPVSYTVATPLPRQAIPGDRRRVDAARETAFRSPAERHLARFAEPGRAVPPPSDGGPAYRPPAEADFRAALREPVRTASNDFTEVVDLKRIVAGMKREMSAYLAGGGTVEGYLSELERRQKLEISYRENAERRLGELLSRTPANSPTPNSHPSQLANSPTRQLANSLSSAYAYWLKANAQLKSMGIYELSLPDALRSYQASLDIEE